MAKVGIDFEEQYRKLNKAQKDAVEAVDGPVMVVAGPGTGKTQILALRIANILQKTDIKADGILCLTFTNSAVEAMQERLKKYIGKTGEKVNVFTFHSFGMKVIEENYKTLGRNEAPKLLEDTDIAIFFDHILEGNEWKYLRPRGDGSRYYVDLKSLISLMKRERMGREFFLSEIEKEIKSLEEDEESISKRGESKGELKKEVQKRIEDLEKSKEVAKFIALYEEAKKEKNVLDYDDVLENLVSIVENSADVISEIKERYLYVLIDEHQDSSRVQNEFLKLVWGPLESPDIFVVGDDRQLIYGFSGASILHFQGFKKTFKHAKLITLVDNYRSTQIILNVSHALLPSVMSAEKLISQRRESYPIRLVEADYPDEEIISAGFHIKEKMKSGINADDCAILVPKNKQAQKALETLFRMGIPVSPLGVLNLFDQEEAHGFLRILKILSNDGERAALAMSFLDSLSGIPGIEAHKFLVEQNMREFSLETLSDSQEKSLFGNDKVSAWIEKLSKWRINSGKKDPEALINVIAEDFSDEGADEDSQKSIVSKKEIADTLLALLSTEKDKNPEITLREFVEYLERLVFYNEHVDVVLSPKNGVKVLTMHSSKGLEFDYVWIAHMDELSLASGKRAGLILPKGVKDALLEQDIDAVKRKLFVAITRAKRFCTLSYASMSHKGRNQELAKIIASLPAEIFQKVRPSRPESGPRHGSGESDSDSRSEKNNKKDLSELTKLVADKYKDRYVSASLLNNFFECPWKWYFNNLLGLPSPRAETLEFGTAVHSAVDRILKMRKVPTSAELEIMADEEVSKLGFGDARVKARMSRELFGVISRWVKNRLPEIKLSRKTEQGISVKDKNFPHLKIYGKIDLIENLGPKEARVTDFKTGSARKKSDIEKKDEEGRMSGNLRQLAMYSYLLRENPKWNTNVRESRLEFLETKNKAESFYDTVIGDEQINLIIKDIADYDKLIKEGVWVERPCHYNSYGKNTECEYCKLAEIYIDERGARG